MRGLLVSVYLMKEYLMEEYPMEEYLMEEYLMKEYLMEDAEVTQMHKVLGFQVYHEVTLPAQTFLDSFTRTSTSTPFNSWLFQKFQLSQWTCCKHWTSANVDLVFCVL